MQKLFASASSVSAVPTKFCKVTIMPESRDPYAIFLYYLAKVWGFAPFTLTNNRAYLGSSLNVVYSTCLAIICIPESVSVLILTQEGDYASRMAVRAISNNLSLQFGILGGGLFFMTIVFNRQKITKIINTLYKVSDELNSLGAKQGYKKFYMYRAIFVGIIFCSILSLVIGTLFFYGSLADSSVTFFMIYSIIIVGVWLHLVHHQGLFIFSSAMDLVQRFYRQINDQLLIVRRPEYGLSHVRIVHRSEEKVKLLQRLEVIGRAYDTLREATENLVEVFSPPIIGTLAYYFTLILNTCYNIYVTAPGAMDVDYESVENLSWVLIWLSVVVVELVRMAAVCSSTQKTVRIR